MVPSQIVASSTTNASTQSKDSFELLPISIFLLAVSIFALALTVFTFVGLKEMRVKKRTFLVVNLVSAVLLWQLVFVLGTENNNSSSACYAASALSQFFALAATLWLFLNNYAMFKAAALAELGRRIDSWRVAPFCIGWGLPLLITLVGVGVDQAEDADSDNYGANPQDACFMESYHLWAFYVAPLALAGLASLAVFFKLSFAVSGFYAFPSGSSSRNSQIGLLATGIFLVLQLGTWVFEIITVERDMDAMQVLFAVLACAQGLFVFIFNCVCCADVRQAWQRLLLCQPAPSDDKKPAAVLRRTMRHHEPRDDGDLGVHPDSLVDSSVKTEKAPSRRREKQFADRKGKIGGGEEGDIEPTELDWDNSYSAADLFGGIGVVRKGGPDGPAGRRSRNSRGMSSPEAKRASLRVAPLNLAVVQPPSPLLVRRLSQSSVTGTNTGQADVDVLGILDSEMLVKDASWQPTQGREQAFVDVERVEDGGAGGSSSKAAASPRPGDRDQPRSGSFSLSRSNSMHRSQRHTIYDFAEPTVGHWQAAPAMRHSDVGAAAREADLELALQGHAKRSATVFDNDAEVWLPSPVTPYGSASKPRRPMFSEHNTPVASGNTSPVRANPPSGLVNPKLTDTAPELHTEVVVVRSHDDGANGSGAANADEQIEKLQVSVVDDSMVVATDIDGNGSPAADELQVEAVMVPASTSAGSTTTGSSSEQETISIVEDADGRLVYGARVSGSQPPPGYEEPHMGVVTPVRVPDGHTVTAQAVSERLLGAGARHHGIQHNATYEEAGGLGLGIGGLADGTISRCGSPVEEAVEGSAAGAVTPPRPTAEHIYEEVVASPQHDAHYAIRSARRSIHGSAQRAAAFDEESSMATSSQAAGTGTLRGVSPYAQQQPSLRLVEESDDEEEAEMPPPGIVSFRRKSFL